ncbi:hypothetical protein VTO73DRAFT_481 [Trametes versicolor]
MAASPDDTMASDLWVTSRFIRSLLEKCADIIIRVKIDIMADEHEGGGVAWLDRLCGCVEELDGTLVELLANGIVNTLELKRTNGDRRR